MSRKRRKSLKYSKDFEALSKVLKSRYIKAIERHCRHLIDQISVFDDADGASKTDRIPFEMFDYDFVLVYDHGDEIWVLHVVNRPLSKGPKGGGGQSGKRSKAKGRKSPPGNSRRPDGPIEAHLERVGHQPQKLFERILLDLYRTMERFDFDHSLTAFMCDRKTMRDFSGLAALARRRPARYRVLPRHAATTHAVLDDYKRSASIASDSGVESRLERTIWQGRSTAMVFSTDVRAASGPVWDLFGERPKESEQLRA